MELHVTHRERGCARRRAHNAWNLLNLEIPRRGRAGAGKRNQR